MRKFTKSFLAGTLSLAMVLGMTAVVNPEDASAKKKVKVKKVTVTAPSGKTVYVAKGKKVSLTTTVKVSPNKKANKKVSFKSANKKIATVNGKGKVKGVKPGKTKITVISKKNSKKKATIRVVVKKSAVKKLTLNKKTASLSVGGKLTLKAKVSPSKNVSKKVAWTSSNKKVARVSSKGVVTGKAEGTAKITAKTTDGSNKKATCTINVGAGIADVKVPHRSIVTVSLTSPKAGLTEENFNIQTKYVEKRNYVNTAEIQKVRTNDNGKTYDVILDSGIAEDSFVKVTINALKGENTKEVFVESIAGYGYAEDEIDRVKGKQGESYSDEWAIGGRDSVGTMKYSVENLPAGLKAYFNKDQTSVEVRGVFANVENGTTATLKGVDEKGQTFAKKYVFYVGARKTLVGNVLSRTVLSYTPDNTETKVDEESGYDFINSDIVSSWACISGGSGNYEYSVSGLPAAVDTMTVEGRVHSVKKDQYDNDVREAIPAGTYNAVLTVKDKYVENLSQQFPFTITVTDGVTVTGSVKDAAGAGMKQADVSGATKWDAYGYRNYIEAVTKADGTYSARVIPGDYYTSAEGTDLSIGNNFAGPATKDFNVPLYKVTFNTSIAFAAAYRTVSTPYFIDAEGRTYDLQYDRDDYSLFAYLRKGSYEMQPATGVADAVNGNYISYNNTIYAYTKVSTSPYKDGVQSYVNYEDRVGERAWQVSCAPFTVAGAMNVTLTGNMLPEEAGNYWY